MSLSEYFLSQAAWRRQKAEEYPDDERNLQSACALESLAEWLEENPRFADQFEPFMVDGVDVFTPGENAGREASRYGFGYNATSESQHEELLEDFYVACLADAFAWAQDNGEDWTGELFDFEVEAARDHVFLPDGYFRRRARQTEEELERAVAEYRLSDVEAS
jgi:hypothetical protein